ncbi:MAG: hypothetical protein QHH24_07500, partial [Candidatus Bathyarchaeota archaeon]|nr:hypothetical protein [Candidatus Bathyarchaeota archaeon]
QLLKYEDTPVMDILQFIAGSADKSGVIGYDFRVAPDGKFEFFPRLSKTSPVSLAEKIEASEYRMDIHRVRNKVTVYGAADKSVPADKDSWTESLDPADGVWSATSGNISLDTGVKIRGSAAIKVWNTQAYYSGCVFTLDSGKEVNAELYPLLCFYLRRDNTFNGNMYVALEDSAGKLAYLWSTVGAGQWFQKQFRVGSVNADLWTVDAGFNWTSIKKFRVDVWFETTGEGSMWVDGLFFGGRRYSATQEDTGSQTAYGLRELVDTDEELYSDNECTLRAKAILAQLKDPAEYLTVRSTVIDYGNTPLLPGDKIHVVLPNENVDADFRILSAEYSVDAKTQTLEIALELGREVPLLADYVYALQSRTSHVRRYKIARAV